MSAPDFQTVKDMEHAGFIRRAPTCATCEHRRPYQLAGQRLTGCAKFEDAIVTKNSTCLFHPGWYVAGLATRFGRLDMNGPLAKAARGDE